MSLNPSKEERTRQSLESRLGDQIENVRQSVQDLRTELHEETVKKSTIKNLKKDYGRLDNEVTRIGSELHNRIEGIYLPFRLSIISSIFNTRGRRQITIRSKFFT